MAGRPKIYNETDILDKAIEVFWTKGYENATADDLLSAMGIGKGSFYLAFKGGKEELFRKSMDRVVEQNFVSLRKSLNDCEDPLSFVKNFFFSLTSQESPIGNQGCYFGNALVQISSDEGLKVVAARYLHELQAIFTTAMIRAKEQGKLANAPEAAVLGSYLLNLWNGINITRRMEKDNEKLAELVRLNLSILA